MMLIDIVIIVSFDSCWSSQIGVQPGGASARGLIPTASIVIVTCLPTA